MKSGYVIPSDNAPATEEQRDNGKTGATAVDRDECIQRAAQLVPVLQERAGPTEALRRLPEETIEALCRADLLRVVVPPRFGGLGLDFDVMLEVGAELGRGCGSTAWCYGIWASCNWLVGLYPEQTQEEYWATGIDTLCAGSLNPAGATSVSAVDGGYRLSGQWDFASGCDAATWILVPGIGPTSPLIFLLPRSGITIEDTWFTSGLRGTGSKDIIIQDAFVPAHRVLSMVDMQEARTPGRLVQDTANYRFPLFSGLIFVLAAAMVGMAQGAVESFRSTMASKVSGPRGGQVAQLSGVQVRIAGATTEVRTAGRIMQHEINEVLERARRNEMPTLEERLQARCTQAYVATLCVQAVNRVFEGGGAHALFDRSPLQRFHRDVHAASHHAALSWDIWSEQYGRVLLGLEPTNRRF
jgi:3-hydroxy-9,10-secoandrosta-1,3,5(10)-triene-9,17-dione monooxygenase